MTKPLTNGTSTINLDRLLAALKPGESLDVSKVTGCNGGCPYSAGTGWSQGRCCHPDNHDPRRSTDIYAGPKYMPEWCPIRLAREAAVSAEKADDEP